MQVRPLSCCTRRTSCASAQLSASGISTWTCLPARIAAMACAACSWVGVHKMTASTSSLSSAMSRLVEACATPYFSATSSACSSLRLITQVTVTPSMSARASRCLRPNAPAPATAMRMGLVLLGGRVDGPDHHVPHGGVGSRHVVEAVELGDLGAHRAAHDQLHDQLDPLRASLAHVLEVRHQGQVARVVDQPVEEGVVELGVDEPGAGSLQLVAHPAGAPDVHREVLVEALHRPADGLAEHVAAVAGRRRVLHDVDRERDDPYRPLLRLAVD